jgi:hypothetical protein
MKIGWNFQLSKNIGNKVALAINLGMPVFFAILEGITVVSGTERATAG